MKQAEAFASWLRSNGYREATVDAYTKAIRRLDESDPTALLRAADTSQGYRLILSGALKRYMDFIGGPLAERIATDLRSLPRRRTRPVEPERPLTDAEWRALMSAIAQEPQPMREVLSLLSRTGLRIGDIGHVERAKAKEALSTGVLRLEQKRGGWRTYPATIIKRELRDLLVWEGWQTLWQAISTASFESYYMGVSRALRKCGKRAKLGVPRLHPHLLRKTVASQLLRSSGGNIEVVRKLLGQADIRTTQRYVEYVETDELGAVMSDLDKRRT